jgi:hypothetical protein
VFKQVLSLNIEIQLVRGIFADLLESIERALEQFSFVF